MEQVKPDIYQYQDFRKYLKDVFEFRKSTTNGFSLRTLQKEMGLKTHAHYFDVMYGRNLTGKFLPLYIKWFGFDSREEQYFSALVVYAQSSKDEERREAFAQMVKLSPQLESLQMGVQNLEFFAEWYQPVLLVLLTLYPEEKDPELLARLFHPRITPAQVSKGLQFLQKIDLAQWNESQGRWVLTNRFLQCEDETRKMALKPYHRKMQELGIWHYDNQYEKQQFASMTLATTEETVGKVREIVNRCRKEIMDVVRQDPGEELLLQVNMQTFQVVKKR